MEYYGSCLSPIEKKFYLKILDAFQNRLLFVKAEGIANTKSFLKCISAVEYDFPWILAITHTWLLRKVGNIVRSIYMKRK